MMRRDHLTLYLLVLGLLILVVFTALGGGLLGQQQPWFLQWQHQLFAGMCHQNPARSFWIDGQPMAVCSRCFGVYSGLLAGWVMLPLMALSRVRLPAEPKWFLLAFFVFNLLDVVGNVLGFWQNTLVSRLIFGGMMGIAAAMLFSDSFFTTITKKQEYYGRITTTARTAG